MDCTGENFGGEKDVFEIRIVLVGNRSAGKSSAGNTILGEKEFDLKRTTHCVRSQREVASRLITVIETPGWWRNYPLEETPMLTREQMELSVSMCPPGPHVFLLVIRLDCPFTEKQQRTTEEHLSLFGENVWGHTIVLFISGNQLDDSSIEQRITQDEALRCLIKRCGNRCHILNSRRRDDGSQVTRLLEKVDEMVADNNGIYYEVNTERIQQLEEKRRETVKQMRGRMEKVEQQRISHRRFKDNAFPLFKLRLVLLGYRASGKSSAGNTILEREEFDLKTTAQCVKRQGNVEGREVTVVEAPGWWRNYPLRNTPRLIREEIEFSVSLCAPGPHAILLVVRVDYSFRETHRRALEEHLGLLDESVWSHTIVLFTFGDWLGDTLIEEHIESEGEDLQWLVEKCGNRYHVFTCGSTGDQKQVTNLLEKIEEIVALNNKEPYKIRNERIAELEMIKRTNRDKIMKRLEKTQRKVCRTLIDDALPLSELRVVVLGYSASGKTSAVNTILGRKEFDLRRTAQCVKRQGDVAGRKITVVEAPGWARNCLLSNTTKLTRQEIELSVSLCTPGPHAVLLVITLDTAFTDSNRKALKQHLELLSERIWSHTMVLFTGADLLGEVMIEEHIEREGKALNWVIDKCENRYHLLNNEDTDNKQVKELLEKISEIVARNGSHFYKPLKKIFDEREKMTMQNKAKERAMKVKNQRENYMGHAYHVSEVGIVLLGRAGAGKRSTGNTILGEEAFDSNSTTQCVKRDANVAERHVTVLKPPGWWRNDQTTKSSDVTKQIVSGLSQCSHGTHAILLVIRADMAFTEKQRRAVEQQLHHLKIPNVWQHVLILFTYGDWLGAATIEQHIESEGHHLKHLVEKCGNRYHTFNNKQKGDSAQVKELLVKIEEMVSLNHGKLLQLDKLGVSPEVGQLTLLKRDGSNEFFHPDMSAENRSETSLSRGSQASLQSIISSLSAMSTSSSSSQSSGYQSACSDSGSAGRFAKIKRYFVPGSQDKRGGHQITKRKRTITEPTPEDDSPEPHTDLKYQQQRISAGSEPCLLQSQCLT